MLRLADTSIRLYRKKDGKASVRLRSYLMVQTNVGFRLSAYLKTIRCHLTLPSGEVIELTDISYSDSCRYCLETMVHDFWASGVADLKTIENGVGTLRLDYHISFTGHESEEPNFIETVVPLVRKISTRRSNPSLNPPGNSGAARSRLSSPGPAG